MIAISQIDLFTALEEKLGEAPAKLLAEYVEQRVTTTFDAAKDHLATKEDIAWIEGTLRKEIEGVKSGLMRWMFVMFAPLYVGMIVFLIEQFL